MKKITFILFAFISITALSQNSSAIADVNAEIVSPIAITGGGLLDFGSIAAAGGGNVRVSTDGTRTFSNPEMEIVSSTPVTAATFQVNAALDYSFNIHIPGIDLTRAGGTEVMNVTFTHNIGGETDGDAVGTGADEDLLVGGLLSVGADQAPGAYTGVVTVTVAYQ